MDFRCKSLTDLSILQMIAPSRVMFLFSCCIMMIVPFLKVLCLIELEDHVAVTIMLTTAPYFLFFCRYAMGLILYKQTYAINPLSLTVVSKPLDHSW